MTNYIQEENEYNCVSTMCLAQFNHASKLILFIIGYLT